MSILSELFMWWGGNTIGTRVTTWWSGRLVGTDELGNRYYVQRNGVGPLGVPRRWVVYDRLAEASLVPPAWHGWLHHTVDTPPVDERYVAKPWEKPHRPNLTGTPEAVRPRGSILASGARPNATGDYAPWRPE